MGETPQVEPVYVAIGQQVLSARCQRGWTQQELADAVGLSRTSIANIELGRQRVLLHSVLDLAAALGVQPRDLIGRGIVAHHETPSHKSLRDEISNLRLRVTKLEGVLGQIGRKAQDAIVN